MEVGDIGFGYRERAAYASHPEESRGRLHPEPESRTRTPFQRDRDRIIHSTAFRRLKHKTQVFIAHEADHYRTRLTHSIEVAQIARALARALRGDEDLAEAVALVHDFGHTPFGHAGERALDRVMKDFGGFDHNAQSLRIVTSLEQHYAEFDGLNLTWETLEGLVKHNGPLIDDKGRGLKGPVPRAILGYDAVNPLRLSTYASLEAQAAAIADDIAYNAHDIDDGLRAGLLKLDMLNDVSFTRALLADVRDRYPRLDASRTCYEIIRRQITAMVEDVIVSAKSRLGQADPHSAEEVRSAGRPMMAFSEDMAANDRDLKAFLYSSLYRSRAVMEVMEQAEGVVSDLFSAYFEHPRRMPEGWREGIDAADPDTRAVRVCDFLAGMTDNYALREHGRLFDHTPELS